VKSDRIVEAELFSANKPVTVTELQAVSGLDARTVRSALGKLTDEYNEGEGAIEIAKMGPRYAMQVKKEYTNYACKLADMRVPKDILKTAALIAYYQPVLQSKMFDLVGNKIYEHVKELEDLGLVKKKPRKNSVELTTTKRFIETFGIDARSRDDVKAWLEGELSKKSKRPSAPGH
jgi:segregation and condensation protein B